MPLALHSRLQGVTGNTIHGASTSLRARIKLAQACQEHQQALDALQR
jgi:hypothetical protein